MNHRDKKGLVFEGGGILGIAYVGALKELARQDIKFDYFVGSSIGSVFAVLAACRVPEEKLEQYVLDLQISGCIDKINDWIGIWRLCQNWGWHSLGILKNKLKKLIKEITDCDQITFSDLVQKYQTHCAVTAFSLESGETVIFDDLVSPDMDVVEACIHSCSYPGFFMVKNYLDGGLEDNYPINYMVKRIGLKKTLGLKFVEYHPKYQRPTSLYGFVKFITLLFFDRALKCHLTNAELKETICIKITSHLTALEFDLSQAQKNQLIQDGQNAVLSYSKLPIIE